METNTQLGRNRTGVQMSPIDTMEMERGMEEFQPTETGERDDLQVRLDYADATEGLGSVPVPGTVKGVVKSSADALTGNRPQVLIDKLGERLAFERGGVRLYDSLLVKCRAAEGMLPAEDVERLSRFRDEEAEHFAIVVGALERLGADPTAQTPCADLVGVESMGLVQAMNDPRTSLTQALHVMLDAELIDNAGWEMLIELARASDHEVIADTFEIAAQQEAEHLVHVRELLTRLTLQDASMVAVATGAKTSAKSQSARSQSAKSRKS